MRSLRKRKGGDWRVAPGGIPTFTGWRRHRPLPWVILAECGILVAR